MNIIIRASNVTLSDEQRAAIEREFRSLADHMKEQGGSDILTVEVLRVREKEAGQMFRIEASLQEVGHLFAAHAEAETVEAAIDAVRAQLSRERSHIHGRERRLGRRAALRTKEWLRGFGPKTDEVR